MSWGNRKRQKVYEPLTEIIGQIDVLELAAREDSGGLEGRSRALDERSRHG